MNKGRWVLIMTNDSNDSNSAQVKQGAAIGGWICFALGIAVMFFSVWLFIIYIPLFIVAFILSIVALAQKRILSGHYCPINIIRYFSEYLKPVNLHDK